MYNVIGWFGMILFLVNYAAVASGKMQATGKLYNSLQVIAAGGIAYSLLPLQAWPTITLELCFIGIGLWTIFMKK